MSVVEYMPGRKNHCTWLLPDYANRETVQENEVEMQNYCWHCLFTNCFVELGSSTMHEVQTEMQYNPKMKNICLRENNL